MRLKKFLVIASVFLSLCACSSSEVSDDGELMSPEEEAQYSEIIENTLNQFYWRYNSDTVQFSDGTVPTDDAALSCSDESGYNLRRFQGRSCVMATADLLYFNRQTAGTVYLYFVDSDISGIYYVPAYSSDPCSMNVRNPYLVSSPFIAYESEKEPLEADTAPVSVSLNGILDTVNIGETSYSIFTDGSRLTINQSTPYSYINAVAEIDLSGERLVPMSAAFINGSTEIAVLYGTETYSESGGAVPVTVPQKVIFFDSEFNRTEREINADGHDLYSVGYDDGLLFIARNRYVDIYPISEEGKKTSFYTGKSITGMEISDLDGDGSNEYIFTDGLDLFIYRRNNSSFKLIWSTHLSVESFESFIYAGDMNGDGVKEIYTFSSSGTTSKYILGEKGMYMRNENIEYGMRLHVADFNCDGVSDCLVLYGDEMPMIRITN